MHARRFSAISRLNYTFMPIHLTLYPNGDARASFLVADFPDVSLTSTLYQKHDTTFMRYAVNDGFQIDYFKDYAKAVAHFENLVELWSKYAPDPDSPFTSTF
jgi:hypothetical protein